jgi:hypothetical protein
LGENIKEVLIKSRLATHCEIKVHGDDNITIIDCDIEAHTAVRQVVITEASALGWKVKDDAFTISPCVQNGKPKFLSHGVTEKSFMDSSTKRRLMCGVITRDLPRVMSKLSISSEISASPNKIERAKLSGKYLSFCMASLGHPAVICAALLALLMLRSPSIAVENPYSWKGLTSVTLSNMTLMTLITMQLPAEFNNGTMFDLLQVHHDELNLCKNSIDLMNQEVLKVCSKYRIKQQPVIRFPLQGEWWHFNETVGDVVSAMKTFERHNVIGSVKGSDKWWEPTVHPPGGDQAPLITGLITACDHSTPIIIRNKTQFRMHQNCIMCWKTRIEHMYEQINFCVW